MITFTSAYYEWTLPGTDIILRTTVSSDGNTKLRISRNEQEVTLTQEQLGTIATEFQRQVELYGRAKAEAAPVPEAVP